MRIESSNSSQRSGVEGKLHRTFVVMLDGKNDGDSLAIDAGGTRKVRRTATRFATGKKYYFIGVQARNPISLVFLPQPKIEKEEMREGIIQRTECAHQKQKDDTTTTSIVALFVISLDFLKTKSILYYCLYKIFDMFTTNFVFLKKSSSLLFLKGVGRFLAGMPRKENPNHF